MPLLCSSIRKIIFASPLSFLKRVDTERKHNELCHSCLNLSSDVCNDFKTRPHHQALKVEIFALTSTAIEKDSRSDIKAHGFWKSSFKKTYFEFKNIDGFANC